MLKVSVDLSRDNDAKKLAIWPSAFGQKQIFAISFMGPSIVIVVSDHAELHRLWFFQHKIQFHHVDEASAEFNG
jgi:hypothetical protein